MVALIENSKKYKELFGNLSDPVPTTFKSAFPTYENIVNGFLDPANEAFSLKKDRLNGDQTIDIRNSSRILLKSLITDTLDGTNSNFPSYLLDGFTNIINSATVKTSLTDNQVLNKVMSATGYNAGSNSIKGTAGVVIGGALLTLSVTVPLLGAIASAIVGLALGISNLVLKNQEKKNIENEETRAELYKTFPPLQVAGSGGDEMLILEMNTIFQSTDWTNIWSPRFKGKEWRGLERQGGFAFAPGDVEGENDEFAGDVNEKFVPSGGFGIIPGTDIVTSVIQVNLPHDPEDPYSTTFQNYMTKSGPNKVYGPDPRILKNAWSRITDVGIYYPSTGKLGSYWWEIALQKGNWYKFRIDPIRLHNEWKEYCESGLRFIRQKCYKWTQGNLNSDYEDYFGSAIYYAIGAWAGRVNGGSSLHPTYEKFAKPIGYVRNEMIAENLYSKGTNINSKYSGAFLPLSAITDQKGNFYSDWWCDSCLGSIYDRGYDIQNKLIDLSNRQVWDLYKTLACAYCSAEDAAFKANPKLLNLLWTRRKILLTHKDRFQVNINDVLVSERGFQDLKNPDSWKQQLIDSGVPKIPVKVSKHSKTISSGLDAPSDLKPPSAFPSIDNGPINPWDPNYKPNRVPRPTSKSSDNNGNGILLLAGVGLGGFLLMNR